MEKLPSTPGFLLYWAQPKTFERSFELRSADILYATLHFQSAFGTLARAESFDGAWTFKRVGFLNARVTIREAGEEPNLAVYQPKFWGDGILTFAEGGAFHWRSTDFWGTSWGFADSAESLLFVMRPASEHPQLSDLFKTQASVEFHPRAVPTPRISLLVMLGWYLMILHNEDAAAAAAASAGATAAT